MAVGRISGPLLKSNLLRNGVDLAFETDLLYLDVNNSRVGINTSNPQHALDVYGTLNATDLRTSSSIIVGDTTISANSITNSNGAINLGSADEVTYQNKLVIDSIEINDNTIRTIDSNSNLELDANGAGTIELLTDTNVTGNLHATGNITAGGNITLGDADTDNITLNAEIASNVIPDANNTYNLGSSTKKWDNIHVNTANTTNLNTTTATVNGINLALTHGNIFYVAENGSDSNTGQHVNNPYLTIAQALTVATAGDTIHIFPGNYTEVFPLTVPAGVTVKGHSLRSVNISPTAGTNNNDAFLLNGEVTIEDLTIKDFFFNSGANEGYAFKFANNFTVTTRSPYIRNVSVITAGSVTSGSDPRGFAQGDAGKGAYLDGQVAHSSSKEAGCLFHAVTFITPGVDALSFTNGTRIEWLNSFTYFAAKGLYGFNSSQGLKNAGQTAIRVSGLQGSFSAAETFTLKSIDGSTVLGTGTIASKDADGKFFINGNVTGLAEASNRLKKNQSAVGGAQLTTAHQKFGTASLRMLNVGDYVSFRASDGFGFGTGDFTLECFVKLGSSTTCVIFDTRAGIANDITPTLLVDNFVLKYNVADVTRISGGTLSAGTWHHVAVSRFNNRTRLYLDGTEVGTNFVDNNNYGVSKPLRIGANFDGTTQFLGYVDDVRISSTARYQSGSFTVATAQLVGDTDTVFLSHFDGADGATIFEEDLRSKQTIEFSGGATANFIDLYDTTDFGGELRAIGSANVYGTFGAYGDGSGVLMYLVGQNFAYIGNGKEVDNDKSTVVQANEVVEANNATVNFTSVDHRGDFRVGDKFYVDQETGEVQLSTSNLEILTLNGLTFTTGSDTTFIDGTKIETGDFRISGSTIQTLASNMSISSAGGTITLNDNTNITGNLDVTGNVTIGGDITIGDSDTDGVLFTADVDSNIIPNTTDTFNLGSQSKTWKNVFANVLDLDDIEIQGNKISTTNSNSNLTFDPSGTGIVDVQSSLRIEDTLTVTGNSVFAQRIDADGGLVVNGGAGTVAINTSAAITGSLQVGNGLTVTGSAEFENINIINNTISTSDSNSDLELSASGTGSVIIAGGADLSVDGDVAISGGLTLTNLTASGNITANSLSVNTLSVAGAFQFENIQIDDNIITTTESNSDLELRASGTGKIRIPGNDLVIEQSLTVNGAFTPANLNVSDTANVTGNLNVSGTTSILGQATFDNIQVAGNLIRTTDSNSNLELDAAGNGLINIPNSDLQFNGDALFVYGSSVLKDVTAGTLQADNIIVTDTMNIAGGITFEDIEINDNIITTTNSNSNLELRSQGSGQVLIPNNNVTITNDLFVTGDTILSNVQTSGTFDVGDATVTGTLTVNGLANFEDIRIDDNFITTTLSNSDLELRANGTGNISIPNNNVVITNDLTVDGTITFTEISSTGKITANSFSTGDILIDDNFITTTQSNSNLELRANGSGKVKTGNFSFSTNVISSDNNINLASSAGPVIISGSDSLVLPNGSTGQRNTSPITGMMRYNVSTNKFEGYNGNWVELSTSLTDSDNDTYVTAENTPGANDNIIRFYNSGSLTASFDSVKFSANVIETGDIEISGNSISTLSTNSNLNLSAQGTGGVVMDNFKIKDNTITNTVADSDTIFSATGAGYFKFAGTRGVVIPSGNNSQRPGITDSEVGMTRYNTQAARVEIFDGSNWVSVAGSSGGISFADAESLALEYVLALG